MKLRLNESIFNTNLNPQEIWNELQDLDETQTQWYSLADDDKNIWAMVFTLDYDYVDDGKVLYMLYGKIAYCLKNSLTNDYDIDWIMPYDKDTGNVDDTETIISSPEDITYLMREWKRMKKEYDFETTDCDW